MNPPSQSPFQTIESARDFVTLLAETVIESRKELEEDVLRESNSKGSTRLDVLRMALYSMEKLELHMATSSRILDDLRSQRRFLFEGQIPSMR